LIHPADLRGLHRVHSLSAKQILLFPWKCLPVLSFILASFVGFGHRCSLQFFCFGSVSANDPFSARHRFQRQGFLLSFPAAQVLIFTESFVASRRSVSVYRLGCCFECAERGLFLSESLVSVLDFSVTAVPRRCDFE
jgi:hypothetical protein